MMQMLSTCIMVSTGLMVHTLSFVEAAKASSLPRVTRMLCACITTQCELSHREGGHLAVFFLSSRAKRLQTHLQADQLQQPLLMSLEFDWIGKCPFIQNTLGTIGVNTVFGVATMVC